MRLYSILRFIALFALLCIVNLSAASPLVSGSLPPEKQHEPTPDADQIQLANHSTSGMTSQVFDYRCGPPHLMLCPPNACCSGAGFCGTTRAHCRSPDCQINFGHCDAHKTPKGTPTKDIPRPHVGQVPYGPVEIRSCMMPGTVALTFDDGPSRYTGDLLDLLDRYHAPATFFVTGINNGKGPIDDTDLPWARMIERMVRSGHQVASHTWSHQDLSKITQDQRREQMEKNEGAVRNILGYFPTYMRPPYSSCVNGCLEDLGDWGYHITLYDIDTDDYKNDDPALIQRSKDIFDKSLHSANPLTRSWLVIAHDAHEQTVYNLTEHMLKTIFRLGFRPVTVGDCLQDPRDNWYRNDTSWYGRDKGGPKKKGPGKPLTQTNSKDGTCGKNFTCWGSKFGLCCGNKAKCGNTTTHCGYGCNSNAGYCTVDVPPSGDAWDPRVPKFPKGGSKTSSEADSEFRTVGAAALTSLLLALVVAMWM
ncbi:hypothetical protein N7495_006433 [Penicillium taxi]|uniref:uncharacterized protein n=1 Tax=Penicillium taxi TaxID=168475 RepID=UPI00254536D7|nr:uncharacterized protein N7495_006433 [Penicillium taxi]KAJ5894742.1 hypothetical protein N7495_006433 [Penicillium taxi]